MVEAGPVGVGDIIIRLSSRIWESLASVAEGGGSNVSVKGFLESLLLRSPTVKDFALACALISSSSFDSSGILSWIPTHLSSLATSSFSHLSHAYFPHVNPLLLLPPEKILLLELMPHVLPFFKDRIQESSIDYSDHSDEFSAASARVPVGFAILAAFQFRWFITQIEYPHLGKFCGLVIPCALTAVDHWSPAVKGQGMISLTHIGKNVDASELGGYVDVILDACCQNMASDDEIWHHVVLASVVLVTLTQRSNPRSPWFERMLNEMLSHLERQPRNKERRIIWLKSVDSLFNGVGLMLLAHFRRIFPLFFQWMHADDDETIILVLKCTYTILSLTWIRNSPFVAKLVDELAVVYKEAALRKAREEIRANICQILILLQETKGPYFNAVWDKHRSDPDLNTIDLSSSIDPFNDM